MRHRTLTTAFLVALLMLTSAGPANALFDIGGVIQRAQMIVNQATQIANQIRPFGLQPFPQPRGQVVRVGSHVRIALLSAATGPPSLDQGPSGSPCLGAAPPGPPPARQSTTSARFRTVPCSTRWSR